MLNKHPNSPYDKDFYKWTKDQSTLLKKGELQKLDIENLIEEIEALGRSEKRALESHLVILLMHLLKTEYQAKKKTNSWKRSIENAKLEIELILRDNPSFKRLLPQFLSDAYETAIKKASIETGLSEDTFPKTCPFNLKDIL